MIKEDELRAEITKLLDAHNSNEIDSRDEWYREMVYFRDAVVKKLNIHIVSNSVKCGNCDVEIKQGEVSYCEECYERAVKW